MKFTSEDLMKAMGLQVGDRIELNGKCYVIEVNERYKYAVYADEKKRHYITKLVDKNFKVR